MSRAAAINALVTLYETPSKLAFIVDKAGAARDLLADLDVHDARGRWSAIASRADDATWERITQRAVYQYPFHRGWLEVDLEPRQIQQYARLADRLGDGVLRLEARLDDDPELVDALWFAHAKNTVDAVCLITNFHAGTSGTGFLAVGGPTGGLVVTNEHVIESVDAAHSTRLEFRSFAPGSGRLQVDSEQLGAAHRVWPFKPDDLTFVTLPPSRATALRDSFGAVRLRPSGRPQVGDRIMVIQHPNGGAKQISLFKGAIVGLEGDFVRYSAHTDAGSSGGLVVDLMWRPVAVHHAGKAGQYNEGIHIDVVNARLAAILQGA